MYWYDGALQKTSIAAVDLTDRGLTLGDGVFDTAAVHNGRVFLRDAHLKRFAAAAKALAIPLPAREASKALDALAATVGDGAVRLTLTRGGGARGLALPRDPKPLLFGAARAAPPPFPILSLAMTAIRRNETSPTARIKALPYLDAILGFEEARAKGADEAVFLNTHDRVTSLASANLFAVFGRQVATPPLSDGVLAGTVRALVLGRGADLGLKPVERSLDLSDLLHADALFATSSLKLVAPCRSLEEAAFASVENEAVQHLQAALRDAVAAECGRL